MVFNSLEFLFFFIVVFVVYWTLTRKWQNYLLLIASYCFYGSWNWKFLFLIFISTVCDYKLSQLICCTKSRSGKRLYLWTSVFVNLSILGFFKYYNFFIQDALAFFSCFGFDYNPLVLSIILPVGISFYTLQTMAYTIDVYREKIPPSKHFFDYALFVSFFPQLVSGPIERASHLIPEIQRERSFDYKQFQEGVFLILIGLYKKLVVADQLAIYVNHAIIGQTNYKLLLCIYFFAFQIYCDFSGYTDIARGTAKLLGFEIRINFNRPYFSKSLAEFWRRWHISLSTWFRDYVYIPMGGSRVSVRKYFAAIMAVFLLSGLWHGAKWTFVIWGCIHGFLFLCERVVRKKVNLGKYVPFRYIVDALRILIIFHLVCFAWIFFRANSLHMAVEIIKRLVDFQIKPFNDYLVLANCLAGLAGLLVYECFEGFWNRQLVTEWKRSIIYFTIVVAILLFGNMNGGQFIYFQF